MLTVLPDLYVIWKMQRQMVADIFGLYGRTRRAARPPTCCIAFSGTWRAMCCAMSPCARASAWSCSSSSAGALQGVLGSLGVSLTRRVAGTAASRWVPLAGAAAVGAYAYWDTLQVANAPRARVLDRSPGGGGAGSAPTRRTLHVRPLRTAQPSRGYRAGVRPAHPPDVHARYNIAPMTEVPIVRVNAEGHRELVRMRWGLVPRWAKDPSIGAKMINARGETLAEKPSFRTAFRRHRCLLPPTASTSGSEATGEHPRKQPLHIGMKDGSLFAMAGLYERWRNAEGEVLDSCTIVTTEANALLRPVHDRMPVIVAPEHYARWLDPASRTTTPTCSRPTPPTR